MIVAAITSVSLSGCAGYAKCGSGGCEGDKEITAAVEKVISQYPALQAPNSVRVQTIDHVVYLYGQVNTDLERSTAQEAALSVSGVKRVVNSMNVSYQGR
jgi:osmotically-inducible protein OsmY